MIGTLHEAHFARGVSSLWMDTHHFCSFPLSGCAANNANSSASVSVAFGSYAVVPALLLCFELLACGRFVPFCSPLSLCFQRWCGISSGALSKISVNSEFVSDTWCNRGLLSVIQRTNSWTHKICLQICLVLFLWPTWLTWIWKTKRKIVLNHNTFDTDYLTNLKSESKLRTLQRGSLQIPQLKGLCSERKFIVAINCLH